MKIKTGIKELDNALEGGIKTHSLIYISGSKESNYNIFANLIMENVAKSFKELAAFFCLEFDATIYQNYMKAKYKDGLQSWKHNIFIEDRTNDILDIENKIREFHKAGVRFFLIDSILRVTNDKFIEKGTATDDIFLKLEALKYELDIVIAVVVRINKSGNGLCNTKYADERADVWLHLNPKKNWTKEVKIIKNKQSKIIKKFEYKMEMEF